MRGRRCASRGEPPRTQPWWDAEAPGEARLWPRRCCRFWCSFCRPPRSAEVRPPLPASERCLLSSCPWKLADASGSNYAVVACHSKRQKVTGSSPVSWKVDIAGGVIVLRACAWACGVVTVCGLPSANQALLRAGQQSVSGHLISEKWMRGA